MSKPIIEVEHVSKCYRIGATRDPYLSLRDELARKARRISSIFSRIVSKDPIRIINNETDFWALSDVSFSVEEGEVVGIIGRNGAGKSTLLKILSQVTPPTQGQITMRGRVASLLEVGTGFHPELTGRENIYLNGAILGMRRKEIKRKFDEIVAFAEIDKFLDTPVKRYSSGMYVRLAFAVAAHLEPEILIVDEVLAVGDAQFQKKCLGKMGEVSKNGRTVLFVSHNMAAVDRLCNRGILLHNGNIVKSGGSNEVITSYLVFLKKGTNKGTIKSGPAELNIYTESSRGERRNVFNIGAPIRFILHLTVERPIKSAAIGIGILDVMGERVVTFHTMFQHPVSWGVKEKAMITVDWAESILVHGTYRFVIALYDSGKMISLWEDIGELEVTETDYFGTGRLPEPQVQGKVVTKANWRIEEQDV